MTPDGADGRGAIEHAIALARRARPGTTAVVAGSLGALRIRSASVETLPTPAGEPGDAVQLVVPTLDAEPSLRRRAVIVAVATTALGGVAAVAWIARRSLWADDGDEPLIIGVGAFQLSRTTAEHAWIGRALRSGLNTQLSQLAGVKIYSQAFIEFLVSREGLSEIEVARKLAIDKMLSGSVLVVGDAVRVETQVIDVETGMLEGAHATVGREDDFLALEAEVVVGVIAKLPVKLSSEDQQRLAARRTANPDVFRLFYDGETGKRPPEPTSPGERSGPRSRLRLPGPRAAWADDARAGVLTLLEAYRRALEAHDLEGLAGMYVVFPAEQRATLGRYFATVRDLRVRIEAVDVAVVGSEAVVSYTRIDDFVDATTGRTHHLSLRVTRTVRRVGEQWRFGPAE